MGILTNFKLFKLRFFRSAIKFSTINLKKFQILLKKENPLQNCILKADKFNDQKDLIYAASTTLKRYGVLIVENCFTENEINNFLEKNKEIDPRLNISKEKFLKII